MGLLSSLFGEKARLVIVLRGTQMHESSVAIQQMVREVNPCGRVRIGDTFVEIIIEGTKTQIEPLVEKVRRCPDLWMVQRMEMGWLPYKNEFDSLRFFNEI